MRSRANQFNRLQDTFRKLFHDKKIHVMIRIHWRRDRRHARTREIAIQIMRHPHGTVSMDILV